MAYARAATTSGVVSGIRQETHEGGAGVLQVNAERKAAVLGHERGQALLTQVCDGRRCREAAQEGQG